MREKTELDPDIFTGMLQTVSDFMKETFAAMTGIEQEGLINTIGYDQYRIIVRSGERSNLVAILKGIENETLIKDMKDILEKIESTCGSSIKEWDGQPLDGVQEILEKFITSGKFDGVYYGNINPEAHRNLLFENVTMGLERISKSSPILLCIEDLQWADPSTLALMHYVARNTRDSKFLIIGSYRPEDVAPMKMEGHPLIKIMELMEKDDLYQSIQLERFSLDTTNELISHLLNSKDFKSELVNRIHTETEGNPLFIIQLIKHLNEEEMLVEDNKSISLRMQSDELEIPTKVLHVISRRLDRVGKKQRRVLEYASIIGETFSTNTLSEALSEETKEILENLREIEDEHLLVHPQKDGYRFDHAKIKEVLYNGIPDNLRKEYHRIIAKGLEKHLSREFEQVLGDIAFHYYNSKDKVNAKKYLLISADAAKATYSNEEAIRFYSQALEFIDDAKERIEILENIGHISDIIGDYERSLDVNKEALSLENEDKYRAVIMSKIGSTLEHKGDYDEGIKICNEAWELVKDQGSMEEGMVINTLGVLFERKCENDKALDYLKNSLEIFEKHGDEKAVANCLNTMGFSSHWLGKFNDANDYLLRALKIWEELGDLEGTLQCNLFIGTNYSRLGELETALIYLHKALDICEKVGNQKSTIRCLGEIGLVRLEWAEYEEAYKIYTRCGKIADRIGDKWAIAAAYSTLSLIDSWTGKPEKALKNLDEPHKIVETIDYKRGLAMNLVIYGHCHLQLGDIDKAQTYCSDAISVFREYKINELSWALRLQGDIYKEKEMWEEAIHTYEEAIDFCKERSIMGAELGRGFKDYAKLWIIQGENEKAREALLNAKKIFNHYKAYRLTKEIDQYLKSLP
jgi:tetratricopeptide (TPR) repeat protein